MNLGSAVGATTTFCKEEERERRGERTDKQPLTSGSAAACTLSAARLMNWRVCQNDV
jgi:hypothetical protein